MADTVAKLEEFGNNTGPDTLIVALPPVKIPVSEKTVTVKSFVQAWSHENAPVEAPPCTCLAPDFPALC